MQLRRKCDWLYPVEWSGYLPIFQWAQCSIMVENSFNNLLKVHEVNSFPWFFAKTAIKQCYWNSPPQVLGLSRFSFICNRYYFGICPYVDYLALVHNFRNSFNPVFEEKCISWKLESFSQENFREDFNTCFKNIFTSDVGFF